MGRESIFDGSLGKMIRNKSKELTVSRMKGLIILSEFRELRSVFWACHLFDLDDDGERAWLTSS